MPKNKDLGQRVSDTFETRWAENARVTQLLKDKLSQSLDNVSMVGNKLKTIKITIPAKHYYYSVSHISPHKNTETDEYLLFDDKEEIMSCTDDSYVDKFSNYILNKINEELEMNSIYEQMNKIDDTEPLKEKYTVRTLKDVKKVTEAAKTEKVERPKGYRGSVGGYYSVDRYGYHFSKQPKGGGVMISEANVDWIRNTFELKECPELEYQTLWGRGVVYKLEKVKEKKDALKESVEDSFDIDKYYTRGTDKDAIACLDDPDLAEYLTKCEEVEPGCKHVCWLIARDEYLDALDEFDLVELVDSGDEVGEFPAILVRDRVYNITEEIMHMLGIDD